MEGAKPRDEMRNISRTLPKREDTESKEEIGVQKRRTLQSTFTRYGRRLVPETLHNLLVVSPLPT